MRKDEIRKMIAARKRSLTTEEHAALSLTIGQRIEQSETFQKATTVLLYHSLDDEVDTTQAITRWAKQKRIILPKVAGNELTLHLYEGEESLKKGAYGIMEPCGSLFTHLEEIALAIIPGVAFDGYGSRLGRGKGYYDRLLPRLTRAKKIGICYELQLVDTLPSEPHDVRMECVVTEKRCLQSPEHPHIH